MTQPFIPPARPVTGEDEIEAVVRVMRTGQVAAGPEVEAFENEFSQLVDGLHCVAVNSGTSVAMICNMHDPPCTTMEPTGWRPQG